ncbi:ankyrin, partial [Zopfia rhizophila CBS 207.26]
MEQIVVILVDKRHDLNEHGDFALQNALAGGYTDIANLLISKGAAVNARGGPLGSPINAATVKGAEILRFLVETHNADCTWTDHEGRTALHVAACRGSLESVKYLLDLGLDVNHKDTKGWSAIHHAAM